MKSLHAIIKSDSYSYMSSIICAKTIYLIKIPSILDIMKWMYEAGKYNEVLDNGKRFLKYSIAINKYKMAELEDIFFKCALELMNNGIIYSII